MIINRITSKELAKIIGVSPVHISYILNNKRDPSMDLLTKIATALNTSVEELFEKESSDKVTKAVNSAANITEKQKQIETVSAHLEEKNLTPEKVKLLNEYIDILFRDSF